VLLSIESLCGLAVFDWNGFVLDEADEILSFYTFGCVDVLGKLLLVWEFESDGEDSQ